MGANKEYDVIVVGVGAMGSAAAFNMAARGLRVLGIEQFEVGHDKGSSGGHSRIIRSVYTEHPSYVPLVRRSFELWRDLERQTGQHLLTMTGGLDIGTADGSLIQGSLAACEEHGIEHRILSGSAVNREFPAFSLPNDFVGVSYPEAGILWPEQCNRAHAQAARNLGATILENTAIAGIEPAGDHVTVTTANGDTYRAKQLVVTAGAWIPKLFPEFGLAMEPERQVVGWFNTSQPELFAPGKFPVFILREREGEPGQDTTIGWYGFPAFNGDPMKFARYGHLKEHVDPDTLNRACTDADRAVFAKLQPFFAAALGEPVMTKACMFTNSPDHHFILGFHPQHHNVFIASPCSGHGFKFSPAIGEIIGDMIETGASRHDISLHDINRLILKP